MAIDDYFGMDAPADRQIGGEWHTWVSTPTGGSMVPYSSLSPIEQAKLTAGREYGANVYTTEEKANLDPRQAAEIYGSYDPALQAALSEIGQNPPTEGFIEPPPATDEQRYIDAMTALYEAGKLTPEQRAAYEANMGITPTPVAPVPDSPMAPVPDSPMAPGPVQPAPGVNPPPQQGPAPARPQGVGTYRNPNDFADWQSAAAQSLRAGPNMGEATGGPAGSYGGGAIWNKVLPQQNDAPMGAMADQRFGAYGNGAPPRSDSPMAPSAPNGDSPMNGGQLPTDFFTSLSEGINNMAGNQYTTPYGDMSGADLQSAYTADKGSDVGQWYADNFWNLGNMMADSPMAPPGTIPTVPYAGGGGGQGQVGTSQPRPD